MIISLVAVGESYNNKVNDAIDYFKGYDVCLLSNIERDDVFYFQKYNEDNFSYFDKLYFTLDLVNKFKQDVFYVDVTKILEVDLNIDKNKIFYYKSHWPYGNNFGDYINYEYFDPLINHWDQNNIDYKSLPAIRETELFFNRKINATFVIEELKKIQPLFREMSIKKQTYHGYDNAEGIALAFALKSLNII